MDKKYILTDETREINGHILHRIKATKDFGKVKAGDLGGWIEKEENLSHEDDCWIYDNAVAYENSLVRGYAVVYGCATIGGYSEIYGHARIYGSSQICDHAQVFGYAHIFGQAKVEEQAAVLGNARIFEKALVTDQTVVFKHAEIRGTSVLESKARIYSGSISNSNQYIVIGPIGSRSDFSTFFLSDGVIMVSCGCFEGNIIEFETAVHKTHSGTEHENDYISAIRFAKSYFKGKGLITLRQKVHRWFIRFDYPF